MAKVKIQGNASGTGVLTVTAPNTSTDRTITLPDATGTLATTADVPSSITDNGDATAITIDSSERVGIGTGSPTARLHVYNANDHVRLSAQCAQNTGQHWQFQSRNNGEFWIRNETTGSNKFVMNTAGVVSIPNGVELGSGTDATAANTLDDYEEGTFTASLTAVNGSITMNSSIDRGAYTKVGRVVHIQGRIACASVSNCSGAVKMALPFTPASSSTLDEQSHYHMFAIFLEGIAYTAGSVAMGRIYDGSVGMQIVNVDSSNGAPNVDGGLFGAGDEVRFNFSYLVD